LLLPVERPPLLLLLLLLREPLWEELARVPVDRVELLVDLVGFLSRLTSAVRRASWRWAFWISVSVEDSESRESDGGCQSGPEIVGGNIGLMTWLATSCALAMMVLRRTSPSFLLTALVGSGVPGGVEIDSEDDHEPSFWSACLWTSSPMTAMPVETQKRRGTPGYSSVPWRISRRVVPEKSTSMETEGKSNGWAAGTNSSYSGTWRMA